MDIYMKCILIICTIFLSACCSQEDSAKDKVYIDVNRITQHQLKEVFVNIEIIPLETKENVLLGTISKFTIENDHLFFLDRSQKSIIIFSQDGKYVRNLHRVGNGPEEYLDIADFAVNPSNMNINLIDARFLRIYDIEGSFISKTQISYKPVHRVEVVNDSTLAFIALFEENGAVIYDKNKAKVLSKQSLLPSWVRRTIPFNGGHQLVRYKDKVTYFEGFSNEIYAVSKDGFDKKMEWDFGDYNFHFNKAPLEKQLKNKTMEELLRNREYYWSKYITSFQHVVESEKYILTSFMHKNHPTTMFYNKMDKSYKLFSGEIGKLILFSKVQFTEKNQLLIVVEPTLLKSLDINNFHNHHSGIFRSIKDTDNPVVLNLTISE
jgi:hypothetical protein